jgi:hypothetical protein
LKGRENGRDFGTRVLSKTAGAGFPGLIRKPAQTGKADFRAQIWALDRFEPLDLERFPPRQGAGHSNVVPVPACRVIEDGRSQSAGS